MRRIAIYTIFAVTALLSAIACSENKEGLDTIYTDGITLNFTASKTDVIVKAATDERNGVDALNENLLNSVYYFIYPKMADPATDKPVLKGYTAGISTNESVSVKIPVSTTIVTNTLFGSYDECRLFAVANPTADIVEMLEGEPTLKTLREALVTSSLGTIPQDNFVMFYDDMVKRDDMTGKVAIDAEIELKRLAAKFTIGAYVSSVIQDPDDATRTYTPDSLSVYFANGVNTSTLGGWDKTKVTDEDFFNSSEMGFRTDGEEITVTGVDGTFIYYEPSDPFYTYPMAWEFNSDHEPYLLYKVRWKVTGGNSTEYKDLYYKLMLGSREIESNQWFNVAGRLTVLGSLYPEDPKEVFLYMNYQVAGWNNAFVDASKPNTPAIIKDSRYLSVAQTEWILNNKNEVTIPFSSSHECEIVNQSIKTTSYSSGTPNTDAAPHYTNVTYNLKQNELTVTHEIYNTLGSGMDQAPIIIEFDIRHKDATEFTEHIKITQNPAITIETIANSGGRSAANDYGYTYVNNAQDGDWQRVYGANNSGSNSSIYFTVIKVSQFDASAGFIIGDPRTVEVDNLDINSNTAGVQWNAVNPVPAPAKYQNTTRTIQYYHPTVDDGSRDNYVAPAIRVNSANCRSGRNETYENAKQRCAAYQEDGYPAGRWRLPTLAECKLIQTMSSNGLVPTIFIQNGTSYYCYAGGWFAGNAASDSAYHPYSDGYSKTTATGGSGGGAARCVYDEWYWSEVDKAMGWDNSTKTFTWGDVPDDFVIPANN